MPNRSDLLQQRLTAFGAATIALVRRTPRSTAVEHIPRQLPRSATAPAALYAEARESESNSDYVHKMKLSLKELRESAVWLEMLRGAHGAHGALDALIHECDELTAICATCIRKARGGFSVPRP